ncbi:MAG: putative toxin-antitoxin system toxin component, PIN family [Prolixibacteraceae bacterium]|nr:putative toxin-antitoxin system toxin component, PIN family [Prolixibacteraceae bacterium]
MLYTNLWISFLISKDFSFLDKYIEKGRIKLIFSEELFSEFISVSERPKLQKYFSKKDIKYLTQIIGKYGLLVKVTTDVNECRDYKDNFLLNLAIDSKADYIATGDNDLLVLKKIGETEILTIKELLDEIR